MVRLTASLLLIAPLAVLTSACTALLDIEPPDTMPNVHEAPGIHADAGRDARADRADQAAPWLGIPGPGAPWTIAGPLAIPECTAARVGGSKP